MTRQRGKYRAPETAERERQRLDAQMAARHAENLGLALRRLRASEKRLLREEARTLHTLERALRRAR